MTNKEAIKYLQQLYPNGGHCWLDEQRMEAVGMAIRALQEEPVSEKKCMFTKDNYTDEDRKVLCEDCKEKCEYNKKEELISEDLEEAAIEYCGGNKGSDARVRTGFIMGANWQKTKDSTCVSKDLDKAEKEWLIPQLDKSYEPYGERKMMELTRFDGYAMLEAIEFGANWMLNKITKQDKNKED